MARLFVRIIRAHHLPPSDLFNESDPFIQVEVNGQVKKTSIIKHSLNPIWDETILFNLKGLTFQTLFPSIISSSTLYGQATKDESKRNTIEFTIFDHDRMSKNEKIGKCYLPLSCIYDGCPVENEDEEGNGPPWWLSLAESQSIVQDYYNVMNIPPKVELKPFFKPEIDDEIEQEFEEQLPELQTQFQDILAISNYKEENWSILSESTEYKKAMYNQKNKPQYLELEIQLEPSFIENRFLDRSHTKPLLIVETILTDVSIGKVESQTPKVMKKIGPSSVPPIHISSSVGESTRIPVEQTKLSPQHVEQENKHLPRLTFSKLARSFKLHGNLSPPPTPTIKP